MFIREITRLWIILGAIIPLMSTAQNSEIESILEVYSLERSERIAIYSEDGHFEAPNWSPDGQSLIINQEGLLYKIGLDGTAKELLDTGPLDQCNNDHGISPDGQFLAISNNDSLVPDEYGTSRIYVMPLLGGQPKLATELWPSYWHGWSPDSKFLVYTAMRNGDFDIYKIPAKGGVEERLTTTHGLDDGPEFSADGKYIFYNSAKSGRMELWRMNAKGDQHEQLTDDPYSNWFPHPSPDGRYLVFLSYIEDQGDQHPPMKKVALRLYDLRTGNISSLCSFTGGQGTINVPSWSPDGSKFAFVSYTSTSKN